MRIIDSARRHGIPDEEMLHALRLPQIERDLDEGVTMITGPSRDGDLLEIGVLDHEGEDPTIIHADHARPQFLPHHRHER